MKTVFKCSMCGSVHEYDPVDLSTAKVGDECELRDGRRETFKGLAPKDSKHFETHPYLIGKYPYRRDGWFSLAGNPPHPADIVRVHPSEPKPFAITDAFLGPPTEPAFAKFRPDYWD